MSTRIETNTNLTGKRSRLPGSGRINRRPIHRFQLRARPWQIQPFLLAPVLSGETMENALLQARVVSDPVKAPLIGWHHEYHFFYVRLSDMDDFDTAILPALLSPTANMSALNEAASTPFYHAAGAPNWAKKCLKRVTECFFREQTADGLEQIEAWDNVTIDGLPVSQIGYESGLESMQLKTAYEAANDASVEDDAPMDYDGDGTITMMDFERQRAMLNYLRNLQQMGSTYETYLQSNGVQAPVEERPDLRRPEWLRTVREFSYPSNTVNPADGTVASALSWSVADRLDKARFFREPGFLFGVTVSRPKVYLAKQTGSLADFMNDALSWLPASLNREPLLSIKEHALGTGPVPSMTAAYVLDVRDLLIYGDQYINFALTETNGGLVQMPTTGLETRYATSTDADALFSNAAGGLKYIRQDGVCHLTVKGAQVDGTARK